MFDKTISEPHTRKVKMSKVRGIRFTEEEESLIEEFLRKNPRIDFSTMAKIAILEFIRKPQISLIGVGINTRKERKDVRPT